MQLCTPAQNKGTAKDILFELHLRIATLARGYPLLLDITEGSGILDPALYACQSLRSGLATAVAQAGVSGRRIMEQTENKSLPVVRRYFRRGSLFTENAAAKVEL